MKSNLNARMMQTPLKANLKTPMKAQTPPKENNYIVPKTPMQTPRKISKEPMPPPSTVKKRNSGYAPSMYPCDQCDRGYASSSARSQHKKNKHTNITPANVKLEKPTDDQSKSFPLIDQGNTSSTFEETSAPEETPAAAQVAPQDP